MSGQNITTASHQWASRPEDQRFLSLEELRASVTRRKQESWTATPATNQIAIRPQPNDGLAVEVMDPTAGERRLLTPTNFAFNQLAQYANAPAAYLRKLPAEIAAINLQWGLERNPMRDTALVLARSNGDHDLRAMTSTSYGRIWDKDVVEGVIKANQDGRWVIPAASYTTKNPKRATTLYASDRDVFIFLVDPKNEVDVGGETLYRGFITWNSEVGSATFGLQTFLYRYVCDNRIIWGAENVRTLTIRHIGGAPERFAYEGAKFLKSYAEESTATIVADIKKAQQTPIPIAKTTDTVETWLQQRGFTKGQSKASVEAAVMEEGGCRSIWDVIQGVTAYARTYQNTDDRLEIERKGSDLMKFATRS